MRRRTFTALIPAAAACLGSCRSGTNLRPSLRLAFTNAPIPYLPVIIAEGLGIYEQAGLSLDVADFSAGAKAIQATLAGSSDVTAGTFEQVVSLAPENRDMKAFRTMLMGSTRMLVARAEGSKILRKVEDLRGQAVGVAAPGGPNHLFLNYVLSRHGVSPADVTVVSIGTNATAIAALEREKVSAAVINETEYLNVRKRGVATSILADSRGPRGTELTFGIKEYPGTVLMARGSWLERNADTARMVTTAIQRAVAWIQANSAEAVLAKMPSRYRSDEGVDLQALQTVIPMLSSTGAMSADGAEAVRRMLAVSVDKVRNGGFDLNKTWTNDYLVRG